MGQNRQKTADLFTFTEEILSGKPHFLYSAKSSRPSILLLLRPLLIILLQCCFNIATIASILLILRRSTTHAIR